MEPILEQIAGKYDTSQVSLPNSMYIGSGLEHQFAIELYMANKGEMVLKVLDSATAETYDKAGYYVYVQTNSGKFIDPHGIYDDENELLQKYRMRQFRAGQPVPSRLIKPKVVPLKNLENWRMKRFQSNSWWSEDPEMKNSEISEIDNWMLWFDEQEEGGGPIDEYAIADDPFENDGEDVFNIRQNDSEICMACGELASQCMQDEMQYGCKPYNKKITKKKKNKCPCGCDGVEEDHDDRSYGCWPCPSCGDDSDADMGNNCSSCKTKGEKRAYGSRLTKLNKTKVRLPKIMRGYNSRKMDYRRERNIEGITYRMLPAGGTAGAAGSPYASKSIMRKRADALRSKGYNARVVPMAGNSDGKFALFLSDKLRFSPRERQNLTRKGIDWRKLEKTSRLR